MSESTPSPRSGGIPGEQSTRPTAARVQPYHELTSQAGQHWRVIETLSRATLRPRPTRITTTRAISLLVPRTQSVPKITTPWATSNCRYISTRLVGKDPYVKLSLLTTNRTARFTKRDVKRSYLQTPGSQRFRRQPSRHELGTQSDTSTARDRTSSRIVSESSTRSVRAYQWFPGIQSSRP
jgi:hypothetical protein